MVKKEINRRDFLIAAGTSTAAALLVACGGETPDPIEASEAGGQQAAADTGPKILRMRIYGDIQNLDPAHRISENDEVVLEAVSDSLVRYAPNSYDVINQLAESIEQSEDGLSVTFKLREGVQWHSGYGEVTTEDVKFSFERFLDPELAAAYADDWATLDHVEIVDDYNGILHFSEPFAPLWHTTLPIASGVIICKKYVEEVGVEEFATNIIGCGPYLFDRWEPEQKVVLKRNPDYYGEQPYYDEIELLPISEDASAEVALEAGELDFGLISVPAIERFAENSNFSLDKKPALRYHWIGMNVEHPKLQDINVRKAIAYAIDVPSILQAAYNGQAEQEFALIAPGVLGHWEDAPRIERDVEKAKEFMAAAGLETLDLRLDLEDVTQDRIWAEITQENLKEIGINVTLNPMDSSTYWTASFGEQSVNNELFTSGYSMQPDPAWATMWFTCEQINVWNAMRWCNAEFDELHYEALTTMDNEEREALYIEMQRIWHEAYHTVWLTHGVRPYVIANGIKPALTPHGKPQPQWFTAA